VRQLSVEFLGLEGKEFVMTERHTIRPIRGSPGADASSSAVWAGVGRRLRRRRTELGFSADRVAKCIGISAEMCEDYETGAPIPASVLAQFADLFDTPVVWFFQEVAVEQGMSPEEAAAGAAEPVVYTVATVEHRAQALVDCFRRLDLEGQQHLLAISMALSRANPATPALPE
jgi:transcriptional regulator with XRE-family HTH domain